jgi:RNA polymerase sigma factor (sigma-70 family)
MSISPETRQSLLIRLKDRADHEAWSEFTEIYRPLVCRLAGLRGMQPADAEDLAQQVLSSVARVISHWRHDPARGKFRTWLHRVASNAIVNALVRGAPDRGSGDSAIHEGLAQFPAADGPASDLLRVEHRREVFRWAARQIETEFQPSNWEAFWRTAVLGEDVEVVSRSQGRSRGSIYAARSRVMKRLKEKSLEWRDVASTDARVLLPIRPEPNPS